MSFWKVALVSAAAALTACTTGYQRLGLGGGYTETQVSDSTWHVKYLATGHTTQESVQTFWLYRCALLTLEKGYPGFEIVTPMDFSALKSRHLNSLIVRTSGGGDFGASLQAVMPDVIGQTAANAPPLVKIEGDIRLMNYPFTARPGKTFDAAMLVQILLPIVNASCGGNVCPHAHTYLGVLQPHAAETQ